MNHYVVVTVRNIKKCLKATELKLIDDFTPLSSEMEKMNSNKMEYSKLFEELKLKFDKYIVSVDEGADVPTITVTSDVIKGIIGFLKNQQNFIFLTDLCGIHYPDQEKELGVVYHLHNLVENKRIRLKTFVTKENPQVDSIVSLYSGANWMERETFDFYGVEFVGHPNLTRILNVEYMDYFPMRKEYPLEDATRSDKDDRFFGR